LIFDKKIAKIAKFYYSIDNNLILNWTEGPISWRNA